VIDFSVIKSVLGEWIDHYWDHGTILNSEDTDLIDLCKANGWKVYVLEGKNPTAEVMAEYLCDVGNTLLGNEGVVVVHVRMYETPNCWSDWAARGNDRLLKILENQRWAR
jgi:6-pyruvoyltetrahydropterin/6-carboxytetrahydropterin synthase